MNYKIKNQKLSFFLLFTFFFFALLQAQNTLEEILTIPNPFGDYQFSSYIKEGSGDVNGDGYDDFIVSKNDNWDFHTYSGEVYLYLGKSHLTTTPDYILTGIEDDMFGFTASLAGDLNGDGYNDVVISAVAAEPAGAGAVYIYLGGDPFDTEPDYILYGYNYAHVLYVSFQYGCYLSASADFNNDGYNDLVIGGSGPSMSWEGQVDVFLGGDPFDIESDFCLYGDNYFERYGFSLSGDINGDGFYEFLPRHTDINNYESILEVYAGCEDFPPDLPVAILNMDSLGYNGQKIICNDINGDETCELLFTYTQPLNNAKYVKIAYFNNEYNIVSIDSINCEYNNPGVATNMYYSDINNDNMNDLLIAFERDYFPNYAGKVMIFYGGTLLDTIPDIVMTGTVNYEYFGKTGYDLGDVNGDGNTDILLGSSTSPSCAIDDYVTIYTEENLVSVSNFEPEILNYKLKNYPNPFNPITTISYELPVNIANTVIEIFNIKGEKVKTLCAFPNPDLSGGTRCVVWDGTNQYQNQVSSGVYLYRIKSDGFVSKTKKMILLK